MTKEQAIEEMDKNRKIYAAKSSTGRTALERELASARSETYRYCMEITKKIER